MRNPATKCLQCINTRPWVSVLLLYNTEWWTIVEIRGETILWIQAFDHRVYEWGTSKVIWLQLARSEVTLFRCWFWFLFNCSQWTGVPILSSGQRTGICPLTKSCPWKHAHGNDFIFPFCRNSTILDSKMVCWKVQSLHFSIWMAGLLIKLC